MSARPTYTTPVGSKFSFVLPPGWFAMITSVSSLNQTRTNCELNANYVQLARKSYDQGMLVSFDYYGDTMAPMFYSPSGVKDEQMKITISGQNSQPIVPQEDPMDISVEFFYSVNKVSNADELVAKKAIASKIHIVKVGLGISLAVLDKIIDFELCRRKKLPARSLERIP